MLGTTRYYFESAFVYFRDLFGAVANAWKIEAIDVGLIFSASQQCVSSPFLAREPCSDLQYDEVSNFDLPFVSALLYLISDY